MIQRAGDPMRNAFILQQGWVISYTQLADGSRQIRRLHLPGDVVAAPSMAMRHHAEDIEALTQTVVSPFARARFSEMFERHPRLTAIMFMFAQLERITYGDRLSCLGRFDCKSRLAFLLIDTLNRMRAIDPAIRQTFTMHLTREQMAEITGMTPIHASRMWSELLAERAIRTEGPVVTIVDEQRLARLSAYVNRFADMDFSWIPAEGLDTRNRQRALLASGC